VYRFEHDVLRVNHASRSGWKTAGRKTCQRLQAAEAERFQGLLIASLRSNGQLDSGLLLLVSG
jgi:hypothetical protein